MIFAILLSVINVIPQPKFWAEYNGGTISEDSPVQVIRDAKRSPESYALDVKPAGTIYIRCADDAGEFYARETLKQLKLRTGYPCVSVVDEPAYRWRGVMLDECRHFFGKYAVKKTLALMAQYKFNVLHWHLTDDQGWRLDVPGHPELVRYGAVRPQSPQRWAFPRRDGSCELDGTQYGPFYYTEADVREILAYAAARHITVVPEIELPGHIHALLAAHPEFACRPENLSDRSPRLVWGSGPDVLCLGNDQAIRFMEEVLDYVCRLFPSEYVHLGGDECSTVRWKECPKCQARVRDEKLGDEKGLQPWVTRHFLKFLAERGKRVVGWDEYLAGDGVPQSAVGMVWRRDKKGDGCDNDWRSPAALAARGHDLVMACSNICYLNEGQGLEDDPFQYHPGFSTLEMCHAFDPGAKVAAEHRSRVIGGQCCNWSEYIWGPYDLEWKMWPRACALAEAFWSGENKTSFDEFLRRMRIHRTWLLQQHVNCAPLK